MVAVEGVESYRRLKLQDESIRRMEVNGILSISMVAVPCIACEENTFTHMRARAHTGR